MNKKITLALNVSIPMPSQETAEKASKEIAMILAHYGDIPIGSRSPIVLKARIRVEVFEEQTYTIQFNGNGCQML